MHGRFASFLRGMYFIRFPFILWLILLVLGPLDRWTGSAAITRGIITPESKLQAATEAFMVFSVGMIVLLLVRIIAVNGDERFEAACLDRNGELKPVQVSWLHSQFGGLNMKVRVFVAAHIPGCVLLCFIVRAVVVELVAGPTTNAEFLAAILGGLVVAYIFWLLVGLVYYWTFGPSTINPVPREVVFPRRLVPISDVALLQLQTCAPPPLSQWLDPAFESIAHLGKGYASAQQPDHLYEGHRLALLAFLGLAVLYVFFFSFTAPVPIPWAPLICNAIVCVVVGGILAGCAWGPWTETGVARVVKSIAISLMAAFLVFVIVTWVSAIRAPRGFSVLGSLLILITGVIWILSNLSFMLDGTRLPVFALSAVLVLLLRGCYPADHYFTVIKYDAPLPSPPFPSEVLNHRLAAYRAQSGDYPPLIVITAEGGGIHSAAWTANVLADLEKSFRDAGAPEFHSSVLLASGVSGGSVGLLPFVREYTAGRNGFPAPRNIDGAAVDFVHNRLTLATDCSSLQAIAWGLSYYDVINFLSPIPLPASAGIAKPNNPSAGLDRSWALERSIGRNLSDKGCGDNPEAAGDGANELKETYAITLGSTADLLRSGQIPAFTFNTTAAETGGRYLLSNYELPTESPLPNELGTDILPAESFLHTFGQASAANTRHVYADMPLATAARLSGAFPYVSSASRVPKAISEGGLHFIDGGYYDNDGTASAMEFLYFAVHNNPYFAGPTVQDREMPEGKGADSATQNSGYLKPATRTRRLPILLIEIRNDYDIDTNNSPESFASQNDGKHGARWGADHQLVAPIEGFYQAGHGSDTFRNRREICIFEEAFQDRLDIHHVIFDYRNPDDVNQPLSWDLTPNQQKKISCAIDPLDPTKQDCSSYKSARENESRGHTIHNLSIRAANWMKDPQHTPLSDNPCQSVGVNTRE